MKTLSLVLFLTLPVLPMLSVSAFAQSATPVSASSRATFIASSDHNTVTSFGQAVVDHYELEVIAQNGTGAIAFTKGLGKPAPNAANEISLVIPEFGGLVPNAVHRAVVSAVNASAVGRSAQSNPFGVAGPLPAPAAPTSLVVGP